MVFLIYTIFYESPIHILFHISSAKINFLTNDFHFLIQSNNSANTPNSHKGTTYQGDSILGSPARRCCCEVSPIQNHVSIKPLIFFLLQWNMLKVWYQHFF